MIGSKSFLKNVTIKSSNFFVKCFQFPKQKGIKHRKLGRVSLRKIEKTMLAAISKQPSAHLLTTKAMLPDVTCYNFHTSLLTGLTFYSYVIPNFLVPFPPPFRKSYGNCWPFSCFLTSLKPILKFLMDS